MSINTVTRGLCHDYAVAHSDTVLLYIDTVQRQQYHGQESTKGLVLFLQLVLTILNSSLTLKELSELIFF